MIKVNEKVFEEKIKNGVRSLFELNKYRVIDSSQIIGEEALTHYFLIDDSTDCIYQMCIQEAYELLAVYICKDTTNEILIDLIEEYIELEF